MITLKKRTRRIVNYLDELDHDDEFPAKAHSAILKNMQHVRRSTIEEVLAILRQRISIDEAIRRIKVL